MPGLEALRRRAERAAGTEDSGGALQRVLPPGWAALALLLATGLFGSLRTAAVLALAAGGLQRATEPLSPRAGPGRALETLGVGWSERRGERAALAAVQVLALGQTVSTAVGLMSGLLPAPSTVVAIAASGAAVRAWMVPD